MRAGCWLWLLAALAAPSGCTELAPRAASGGGGGPVTPRRPEEAAEEVSPERVPPPEMLPQPAGADCDSLRTQARRILETNCASCHQDPANQANFSFCMDVDRLAMSVSSTGKRFLVPGSPEQSRLFERVANGEMPPAIVTQRPTSADVMTLRQWIAGCVMLGSGGFGTLDAGARPDSLPEPDPGPGCGKPGQTCCVANSCDSGGCCVLGSCRGNGQTCPGGPGGDSLPGICASGSCATAGIPCGSLKQACCGVVRSCTAPGAVCPMGGMTCQACGDKGGPCCKNGGLSTCREGLNCVNNAFPNPGMCAPCGERDQACCGDGPAARRHCASGLACQFKGGAAFLCEPADVDAGPGNQ
jgi:hypothetical protein